MFKKLLGLVVAMVFIVSTLTTAAAQDPIPTNPLDGEVYQSSRGGTEYDAKWEGWRLFQPNLPQPEARLPHRVTITLPDGSFTFYGVECLIARADSGRVVVGRRENGAVVLVDGTTKYLIDCLGGIASGFEILGEYYVNTESTNPMAGIVFASPQGDEYAATWGGESGWWLYQPSLPTKRVAHTVQIAMWPGLSYRFNGVKCSLANAEGTVIARNVNSFEFEVSDGNDVAIYNVSCQASSVSGFSIETLEEPKTAPMWQYNPTSNDWVDLNNLLNPEDNQ